jgi:hypothetical protein
VPLQVPPASYLSPGSPDCTSIGQRLSSLSPGGRGGSCRLAPVHVDANLHADRDEVFRDIQGIKERLQLNVEFVRPEDFVPALEGSDARHVFIETLGKVSFYHYDPYAQLLSKVVRGFRRDLEDAERFLADDMVDAERFRSLVHEITEASYAKYPALSRDAVVEAVEGFLSRFED